MIDLSKVQAALQNLQQTSADRNKYIFKPSDEPTRVRIVPRRENPDFPFVEAKFHYDFPGGRSFLSPLTVGKPDPIVEFANKLRKEGAEWNDIKKFYPRSRYFVPVVVRGSEESPPVTKWWGISKTLYEEILTYIIDPDYGDITDPFTGRDLKVTKLPSASGYAKIDVKVSPRQTPIVRDQDELNALLEAQVDFFEVFEVATYEELQDALDAYVASLEEETAEAADEETPTPAAEKPPFDADVEEKIDDLFDF